jgi:hypothetical protein
MLGVQTDLLRQAILTGIVQLFAVLAITALALRAIIRPLSNITDRLVRLANGRVDEQVPELQRSDVIGDMARAVDTFRESIIELGKLREEDLLKAENLEKARDDAEAASQAKSQFLAAMSHELRTPLNGILGFAQLLVLDADEDLNAEQRQAVDHILSSGNLLLELIDQVLDLEKIEAKESQISMSEVPIAGMVGECLPAIERIASRQGIGLEIASAPADLRVSADPLCLKQILLNLLSNAVKYNRQGGRVALSYDDGADGRLRVAVSDTGYGIAADDLEAIFEPFNRLDASHSGIEGTGIGLTITKRLIEQMHGRIGVDTTPGQGSTFWVELERVA